MFLEFRYVLPFCETIKKYMYIYNFADCIVGLVCTAPKDVSSWAISRLCIITIGWWSSTILLLSLDRLEQLLKFLNIFENSFLKLEGAKRLLENTYFEYEDYNILMNYFTWNFHSYIHIKMDLLLLNSYLLSDI